MPLAAVPTHQDCALLHRFPVVGLFFLAARCPELFRALSCNLERFGELAGSEDGQVGGQSPQAFGFGGVGFAEFEQPCLPCDQIDCLGLDGQVEKVIILGMLRKRKFGWDIREPVGKFQCLLKDDCGVCGRETWQSRLEFRAEEKSAQFIKQPLAHRQA